MKKPSLLILFTLLFFGACTKKETVTKTTSTGSDTITMPGSGTPDGTYGTPNATETDTCGVKTGNDEIDNYCYKTVSPTVIVHGLASGNTSFQTSSHATIPQSYFESDYKFQVRIVPKQVDYIAEKTNGFLIQRKCMPSTTNDQKNYRYSKLQVELELVKKGSSYSGDRKTISATFKPGSLVPSSKVQFATSGPGEYDIIVKKVSTNHRCSYNGTKDIDCSLMQDIPYTIYDSRNLPTDCVGFEIQFATDYTRNLP